MLRTALPWLAFCWFACLFFAPALVEPQPAWAQTPGAFGAHGLPAAPRPLAERLREADAVALAVVDAVGSDRVRLRDALPVRGKLEERFEVKRSPARPHELAAGESVLLLLRGARSPYLLVDEPREILRVESDEALPAWRTALRRLESTPPRERSDLYASWIDGESNSLREEALRGLVRSAAAHPLSKAFLDARMQVVRDAAADPQRRSASAYAAGLSQSGIAGLLAWLPGDSPEVVNVALRAGVRSRSAELDAAILRCLENENPALRRAAIPHARGASQSLELREALEQIAADTGDPEAQQLAQRALRR